MEEVYELPSTEIIEWKNFFRIYPFSEDRQDIRIAQLSWIISKVNGGKAELEKFIPDYLKIDKPLDTGKSLETQEKELAEFKRKYLEAQKR